MVGGTNDRCPLLSMTWGIRDESGQEKQKRLGRARRQNEPY